MNDLQKELQELKAKVAELESRIVAEPVAKWQPKGGQYYVECLSSTNVFDRETKEQAERAAVEMRRFNRLLALRDELCGDEDVDWTDRRKDKHYVYFTYDHKRWCISENVACESVTPYFTTKEAAQKACDMLNSGEVEL
jgi:hypothetical protein